MMVNLCLVLRNTIIPPLAVMDMLSGNQPWGARGQSPKVKIWTKEAGTV